MTELMEILAYLGILLLSGFIFSWRRFQDKYHKEEKITQGCIGAVCAEQKATNMKFDSIISIMEKMNSNIEKLAYLVYERSQQPIIEIEKKESIDEGRVQQ